MTFPKLLRIPKTEINDLRKQDLLIFNGATIGHIVYDTRVPQADLRDFRAAIDSIGKLGEGK